MEVDALLNVDITIKNHHFQWDSSLFRLGHFQVRKLYQSYQSYQSRHSELVSIPTYQKAHETRWYIFLLVTVVTKFLVGYRKLSGT